MIHFTGSYSNFALSRREAWCEGKLPGERAGCAPSVGWRWPLQQLQSRQAAGEPHRGFQARIWIPWGQSSLCITLFFTVLLGGSVEPAYLILGIYLLCSTPLSLLPTMLCKMRLTPLSVGPLLQSPCLQHPIMKGFWWCYLRPCPGRLLPCVYDQYVSWLMLLPYCTYLFNKGTASKWASSATRSTPSGSTWTLQTRDSPQNTE